MWPVIDFIFPRVCHICGNRLADHEDYICESCLADMPRTYYHRTRNNPMELRFAGRFPFERATALFYYARESALSTIMQDLKYHKFPSLAVRMGKIVGEELFSTGFFSDVEKIMPVPMHFLKKALRGYNQTEKIAEGVSEATDIPTDFSLKAGRPHRTQTSLTREERLKNTSDIFRLDHAERHEGAHILLLDDVCTTGATLTSAALAVLDAVPDARLSMLTIGVTF